MNDTARMLLEGRLENLRLDAEIASAKTAGLQKALLHAIEHQVHIEHEARQIEEALYE